MNAVEHERVVEYLNSRSGDMVVLLESLTRVESPSSDAASQFPVKEILRDEFARLGYRVRLLSGRTSGGSLFAAPLERERGRSLQLLLGHFDTVWPVGTLDNMPFEIEGNVVRGPGVFDMKGGVVQIIFALRTLRELGLTPHITPVVFLNSDEEIGSRESGNYIRMLAKRVERAFVMEPALGPDGAIKTARKGVGRFTVRVKGKAAHAGLDPEGGASAILELSHVIQCLFQMNDPEKGISVNVGTIDGGIRPNVIAPESKAVIDVRVATNADAEKIEREIRGIEPKIPGVTLEIDGFIGRPPLEPTPANRALWGAAKDIAAKLDLELTQGLAGGGSDGSTTSQYTATLDGMGPVGDGAHAHHEHLLLDKTIERAALLALLILAPAINGATR
ncbi:MAG: M20 family metallopeptidase [Gammaproteobacteria bacterium]|nr:M20 family metallopeptidase [Gammaproteobacteria bacterium]MBT8443501.1 M20 family metallopeptidase [Gammaproteobacteria bacterium]NND36910.1 M20 family metallopeptidase [Gammaproteobacteria bacterium]